MKCVHFACKSTIFNCKKNFMNSIWPYYKESIWPLKVINYSFVYSCIITLFFLHSYYDPSFTSFIVHFFRQFPIKYSPIIVGKNQINDDSLIKRSKFMKNNGINLVKARESITSMSIRDTNHQKQSPFFALIAKQRNERPNLIQTFIVRSL